MTYYDRLNNNELLHQYKDIAYVNDNYPERIEHLISIGFIITSRMGNHTKLERKTWSKSSKFVDKRFGLEAIDNTWSPNIINEIKILMKMNFEFYCYGPETIIVLAGPLKSPIQLVKVV